MAAASAPDPTPKAVVVDVPGDASTSFSIAVGAPLEGVLEVKTDHDWYAVNLVAGTRYRITLDGIAFSDYALLEDPYIYLRDSSGNLLKQDDDGGPGRDSLLNWIAPSSGLYFLDVGAWNEDYVGGYRLSISEFTMPAYSLDQIADFLTTDFWNSGGHRWDTRDDNIITYNVTALTAAGQTLARAAFQTWANVTNLVFQEVESGGDIPFDDNQSGAFAGGTWSGGLITSMRVNVSTSWLASYGTTIDSYSFQTYVHEIGHALGLGHGGPYNGSASYGLDNLYVNDVWSFTIMSYFDQAEADFGSYRFVMGPSLGDILAVQNLYGANTTFNSGDSVYGRNATAGSLYDFANFATVPAFSIYDTGGADTLDASGYGANQTVNLNAEAFSSIGGLTNNIAIARGVVIEAAIGGNGSDGIIGNASDNLLIGNAGADTLDGGAANASLDGDAGADSLIGGAGDDLLITDGLGDYLEAGDGDDVILLGGTQLADIVALFGPWG
jgi:serralysin